MFRGELLVLYREDSHLDLYVLGSNPPLVPGKGMVIDPIVGLKFTQQL